MARIVVMLLGIWLACAMPLEAQDIPFPDIAGWKPAGDIQVFQPQNLYEYINGGADLYLACDFEQLRVAEYRQGGKAAVTIEIYRHRTPRDAFGIYSQERLPEASLLGVGDEGYYASQVLNFLNGRHYVKISGYDTGDKDRELLAAFARAMAAMLGGSEGLPVQLKAFPAEGKAPRSERYITRNFLGYSFLKGAFTADYDISGKRFKLFLIEAEDANGPGRILEQYRREVKMTDEPSGGGRHRIRDPHHGLIEIGLQGPYLWGACDLADRDLRSRYLDLLEAALRGGKVR